MKISTLNVCLVVLVLLSIGMNAPADAQTRIGKTCTISWTPNQEPDIHGYRIWASQSTVVKSKVEVIHPVASTTCAAVGIDQDGAWRVHAVAFDTANNQSPEATLDVVRDSTPPSAPGGLKVVMNPSTVATALTWDRNAEGDLSHYTPVYCKAPGCTVGSSGSVTGGPIAQTDPSVRPTYILPKNINGRIAVTASDSHNRSPFSTPVMFDSRVPSKVTLFNQQITVAESPRMSALWKNVRVRTIKVNVSGTWNGLLHQHAWNADGQKTHVSCPIRDTMMNGSYVCTVPAGTQSFSVGLHRRTAGAVTVSGQAIP